MCVCLSFLFLFVWAFFFFFQDAGRFSGPPVAQNQLPGGSIPLGTAFIFKFSDGDGELGQKGHQSGQFALAPRRSSRSSFARASLAHSSTQVRNVTAAHRVDGCETRRAPSPFDEIYMARAASGWRCRGLRAPPAARGSDPARGRLCANLGARWNQSERRGRGSRSPRTLGRPGAFHLTSGSPATASKWKDCKPSTTSRPGRSERS